MNQNHLLRVTLQDDFFVRKSVMCLFCWSIRASARRSDVVLLNEIGDKNGAYVTQVQDSWAALDLRGITPNPISSSGELFSELERSGRGDGEKTAVKPYWASSASELPLSGEEHGARGYFGHLSRSTTRRRPGGPVGATSARGRDTALAPRLLDGDEARDGSKMKTSSRQARAFHSV